MRDVPVLPTRLDGLSMTNSQDECDHEYAASCMISSPLTEQIIHPLHLHQSETSDKQRECRKANSQEKKQRTADEVEQLLEELLAQMERMMKLAAEMVHPAGYWSCQLISTDFTCTRQPFTMQSACNVDGHLKGYLTSVCRSQFNVEHALTCSHGGFRFMRHNEIRDLTAKLFTEVRPNVRMEPEMQPLAGVILSFTSVNREDSARLDIQV